MDTVSTRQVLLTVRSAVETGRVSVSRLAEEAHVSRTTLHRLLSCSPEGVREGTVLRLDRALQKLLPHVARDKDALHHLESVIRECGSVPLLSIPPWESAAPVPMRDLFVEPFFEDESRDDPARSRHPAEVLQRILVSDREVAPGLERRRGGRLERNAARPRPRRLALQDLERLIEEYGWVQVISEGGGGKSTLLRFLAWAYASGEAGRSKLDARWIPVLLDARRVEASLRFEAAPIEAAIEAALTRGIPGDAALPRPFLDREQPYLILMDGLDEVETPARDRVLEALLRLRSLRQQDRFVLAYRCGMEDMGSREFGARLRILPWSLDQQRDLARRIARHVFRGSLHALRDREEALLHAMQSTPEVASLCRTPLLLTLTTLLFLARGSLPARRSELYERMTDSLLAGWSSAERRAPWSTAPTQWLGVREVRRLLEDWALHLWMDGLDSFPRARWYVYLAGALRSLGIQDASADQASEQLLELLTTRTGLLTTRANGEIAFIHGSLAAHLAADAILRSTDPVGLVVGRSRDPRWREVVTLAVERMEPQDASRCMARILDDPDPLGQRLQRGLYLALLCLSYDPSVYDTAVIGDLFLRAEALVGNKTPGLYNAFLEPLVRMQTTRFREHARHILLSGSVAEDTPCSSLETCLEGIRRWADQEPQVLSDWMRNARRASARTQARIRVLCVPALRSDATLWREAQEFMRDSKDAVLRSVGSEIAEFLLEGSNRSRKALWARLAPSEPAPVRCEIAGLLALSERSEESTQRVARIAESDANTQVRLAAMEALGYLLSRRRPAIVALFERIAQRDKSERIRQLALLAILSAQTPREPVDRWLNIVQRPGSAIWKSMVVSGLSRWIERDAAIREKVRGLYQDKAPTSIRRAVAAVMRDLDPAFTLEVYRRDPDPRARELAALGVSRALAGGTVAWDEALAREVEDVLWRSRNICRHCWAPLWDLLDARAVRGQTPDLVAALQQALTPWGEKIRLAFVFGSRGRDEARPESDVDLFIVGEVLLAEIAVAIREAEKATSREINPVVRSEGEFRRLYDSGSAFIHDVVRRPKVFLKGGNDELRAVVGERVVASK